MQSDGIRSSTRFKKEVEYEEMEPVVEARGRVDVEVECKEMDGIKNRVQSDDDDDQEEDFEFRESSIECVNGSADSTGSSQSDWEQTLQLAEEDQDGQMSKKEDVTDSILSKKMVHNFSPSPSMN